MDIKTPLFSVVIPAFQSARRLGATIDSVLSQAPCLAQTIVVDGASDDGTTELLATYGEKVRWISEADRGPYDAMNKGVAMATGEFIYFLGAGDILCEASLAKASKIVAANQSPGLLFLYGNVYEPAKNRRFNGRYNRFKMSRLNICHQAVFYDRRLFERFGNFDLRYPIFADYVFNLHCFLAPRVNVVYFEEVVASFEGNGLSARQLDLPFLRDRFKLVNQHLGYAPYIMNILIAAVPPCWKEARYRWWKRAIGMLSSRVTGNTE